MGDLNVSKIAKNGFLKTQTGTPFYASPEVWKDEFYNSKSDIWSLGAVIYELTTHFPPFLGNDLKDLNSKIQKGKISPIPKFYSDELFSLIKSMIQINPDQRPSCKKLLIHPTISNVLNKLKLENTSNKSSLLQTIRMNTNFYDVKLPKSNYELRKNQEDIAKNYYSSHQREKHDLNRSETDAPTLKVRRIKSSKFGLINNLNLNFNIIEEKEEENELFHNKPEMINEKYKIKKSCLKKNYSEMNLLPMINKLKSDSELEKEKENEMNRINQNDDTQDRNCSIAPQLSASSKYLLPFYLPSNKRKILKLNNMINNSKDVNASKGEYGLQINESKLINISSNVEKYYKKYLKESPKEINHLRKISSFPSIDAYFQNNNRNNS